MPFSSGGFSDAQLLSILAQSKDAIAIYTGEDIIIQFANNAMLSIWGKDRSVIGKPMDEAIPELVGQPFIGYLQEVWRSGETRYGSNTPADLVVDGKRQTFYFDFEYRALVDIEGKTQAILHTATEVSARMETNRLATERQDLADSDNRRLTADNKKLSTDNEEQTYANELLNNYNEELSALNEELRVAYDELNGLNDRLTITEEQARLAKEAAQLGTFDLNVASGVLYWDDRCRELFGINNGKEVTYANDFANGLHPDDRDKTLKAVEDTYNQALTGGHFDGEYRTIGVDDGRIRWVRAVGQVSFNTAGLPLRFIGMVSDITEAVHLREQLQEFNEELTVANEELTSLNEEYEVLNEELKVTNEELTTTNEQLAALNEEYHATNEQLAATNELLVQKEEALQQLNSRLTDSEEQLRFTVNAAEIGTWDLDIENNLVTWDERCKELYGFSKDDIVPYEQVLKYMHPDDVQQVNEAVQYALSPASGGDYDIRFRTIGAEDGRLRWLHCKGKAFFNEGKVYRFSGIAQDITESYLLQQETIELNERLSIAVNAGDLGYTQVDLASNQMVCNDTFKRFFGRKPNESLTYSDMFETMVPAYREEVKAKAVKAREEHSLYHAVYQVQWSDGSLHWLNAYGRARYDKDGNADRMVGMVSDITEQKQNEQRKNDFIGIVSHELRSPLTSLNGYVQMLGMKAKKAEDHTIVDITTKAKRQVDRMSTLITGFLDVARVGEGKIQINRKCFNMADLVKLAEEESLATVTTHQIIYHPVEYTPVEADQDKIEQVLVNFVNNAVKYSPPGSAINVSAVTQDGKVKVRVADEGMGIPLRDQPHVFDRFYRVDSDHTKNIKGFGIGLYLCKEIIERHGGRIGVNSEPGQGSEFWFELPVDTKEL